MRRTCELTSSGLRSEENEAIFFYCAFIRSGGSTCQHGLRRTGQDFAARARTSPHGPGLRRTGQDFAGQYK
uniref:Uncharacterized protein n=1 Tax=Strigamia maritima TaxID=126957 RepID=T1JKR8_STRMM